MLLDLKEGPLDDLFKLYREQFGENAARYARHTYQINSTFETATGTTSVEIKKSRSSYVILAAGIAVFVLLVLVLIFTRFW